MAEKSTRGPSPACFTPSGREYGVYSRCSETASSKRAKREVRERFCCTQDGYGYSVTRAAQRWQAAMSRVPRRPRVLRALVYLLLRLGRSRSCSFYTASTTELLYVSGTGSNRADLVNHKNQTTHWSSSTASGLYNLPLICMRCGDSSS